MNVSLGKKSGENDGKNLHIIISLEWKAKQSEKPHRKEAGGSKGDQLEKGRRVK